MSSSFPTHFANYWLQNKDYREKKVVVSPLRHLRCFKELGVADDTVDLADILNTSTHNNNRIKKKKTQKTTSFVLQFCWPKSIVNLQTISSICYKIYWSKYINPVEVLLQTSTSLTVLLSCPRSMETFSGLPKLQFQRCLEEGMAYKPGHPFGEAL